MTVFLLAAMTVDGFIGRSATDRSFDWTSPEDKQFYVDSIKRAGTVIMGAQTFKTFNRHPKDMNYVIYTRSPDTFVNPRPERISTYPTNETPEAVIKMLADKGCSEVAVCGGSSIYTMFLKAGLITKLYLTVEPVVFGSGVKLFSDEVNPKLTLVKSSNLSSQTLLLEYDVQQS